jgi:hypothetical protein
MVPSSVTKIKAAGFPDEGMMKSSVLPLNTIPLGEPTGGCVFGAGRTVTESAGLLMGTILAVRLVPVPVME